MEFFIPISIVIIMGCLAMINDRQKQLYLFKTQLNQAHSEIKQLKSREEKVREELMQLRKQQEEKQIEEEAEVKWDAHHQELLEEERWYMGIKFSLDLIRTGQYKSDFSRWRIDPEREMNMPEVIDQVRNILERIFSQIDELEYFLTELRESIKRGSVKKQEEMAYFSRKRLLEIREEFQNIKTLAPELLGPVRMELEGLNRVKEILETLQNYVDKNVPISTDTETEEVHKPFNSNPKELFEIERGEKIKLLRVLLKELNIQIPERLD